MAPILDRNIPYEAQDIAKIIDMEALENMQEVSFPFPETIKKSDLRFLFTTHDQLDKPINLSITMQLYSDAEQAQTSHLLRCDTSSFSARIYDAGKGELFNSPFKYCTKELKLAQANDTIFPAYYGYYTTSRIQKGNLVIVISENGQSFDVLDRSPVNEAIEKIANTIEESHS